ncbi:hypothetical protein ACX80E_12040 [Arthrobacter sp. TMN-49]
MDLAQLITKAACLAADQADPLGRLRDNFILPVGVNYLDGNSLGARPATSAQVATRVMEDEWGTGLIRSWNTAGWAISWQPCSGPGMAKWWSRIPPR